MDYLPSKEYQTILRLCSQHKHFNQLSSKDQTRFIQQAIGTGIKVAIPIKQEYNDIPLSRILEQLGIVLEYKDLYRQLGNLVIRAKYAGNPPAITIYRKSIQQQLKNKKMSISLEQVEEIAIVHELYHHLQIDKPREKGKFSHLNRLFDELAAHSFTQHFLELPFFPLILDYMD